MRSAIETAWTLTDALRMTARSDPTALHPRTVGKSTNMTPVVMLNPPAMQLADSSAPSIIAVPGQAAVVRARTRRIPLANVMLSGWSY